jgi:excisionase family DNA binding protein
MVDLEISLHDVAEALHVHYMTAYRYVREGILPGRKVGRSWCVRKSDLDKFQLGEGLGATVETGKRTQAPWAERLEARLIEGDERGALEVFEAVLRAGNDLKFLYLKVLSPALVAIGYRWEQGELGIFVEHRASNIAMRLMSQVGSRFARRGVSKGTIIMGAPAGEEHALAIAMLADLVRSEGWDVHDLGANMPAESFAHAVQQSNDVVAVCIGVTVESSIPAARETIATVKSSCPDIPVYVGGAAIRGDEHVQVLGADHWAGNIDSLIESLNQHARRK